MVKEGHGERLSGFHAREDATPKRERVISVLRKHKNWMYAAIVVEKCKVNSVLWEPETFYPKFCGMLLRFVFRGRVKPGTTKLLIYTDTLPFTGNRAKAAETTIKAACHADLPDGMPFHVLHHRRESNAWIQVADYCCWAVCRKWEQGNHEAYNQLNSRLAAPKLDAMSRGDGTTYY